MTLFGTVLNSEILQPVEDATVYLDAANQAGSTDPVGSFLLSDMQGGPHVLAFLKERYKPKIFRFGVPEPSPGVLDIVSPYCHQGPRRLQASKGPLQTQ